MNKTVIDASVKFAWAYLITYGKQTDGKWSYYGGCWDEADKSRYIPWDEQQQVKKEFSEMVTSVGVDWSKTEVPKVNEESVFNGTFDEAGTCLATLGRLVLLNGKVFLIGSADNDAAHLAETARKVILGNSDIQDLAGIL